MLGTAYLDSPSGKSVLFRIARNLRNRRRSDDFIRKSAVRFAGRIPILVSLNLVK
jgi:hypothetical protein